MLLIFSTIVGTLDTVGALCMYLVIKLGYNVRPTDYKRQRTYAITEQNAQRMGRCVIDRSQLNNGNPEDVSFAEVLT